MRAFLTLIVSAFLLLAAEPAWAAGDRRVALVIGNSVYRKFPALPNPRNDAEDVTSALKQAGFTVLGGTDLTREQMRDSLRQFARTAQNAEAALVFYAGHGLQYRGRNYLVPVDARLEDEFDLEYETVRVDDVVEELNRADGPRILILDACRNLPLSTRSRDPFSSTGLAKLSGRGLIVAYATQANQVAYDGTGRNSIFTSAFLKSVQEPGLDVTQVFQRVSMSVDQVTQGRQTPELSMSYPGHFYLNRGETEREAWPKARASNDPQLLRDFIAKYPNSFLVPDAKDMIQRLEARGVARGDRNPQQAEQPQPPSTLQLAHRPDAAAAARAREEEERLAWQRLQDEQRRRAETRRQTERERAAAAEQERQRQLQEEEHRRSEARKAEQERLAEDARQKKLAEERVAAEARERQRLEREARLEEERRQAEMRKAEQERLAEEARQRKVAEERAAAEARERQRMEREARLQEERRQAETRKAEQERLAEEARQKKFAEERAAAEARERQRLEREARLEEERRQGEARRVEQERLAEEARQKKLAEE
ncbi:caspase family protein, partial [Enterovirga sp. CN4-39]|uniref:caspase family protein n=1 Tax=Enterovirga sp. CN4-39 TaxID=3400910 RepID=UPI003C03C912